jgi:hypothetical protein
VVFDLSLACAIIRDDFSRRIFGLVVHADDRKKGCNMLVKWLKDVDAALAEAKAQNKPLLIDFSAAPA